MREYFERIFRSKYFWTELAVLICLTYVLSFLSAVEYDAHRNGHRSLRLDLEYYVVSNTFGMLSAGLYYWGFLKRYVQQRKPWLVFISILVMIQIEHFYGHYVIDFSISQMPFLSEENREMTAKRLAEGTSFTPTHSYALAVHFLPMIGCAYLVRSLQQDEQMKALKEQQLTTELNYLKAQLQPHFFFNTLNNIYGLALDRSERTAPIVAKLAEMMRYILYHSNQQWVPLQQEVSFLRSYVDIERIRHHRHVSIDLDIQGDPNHAYIAPLILLPFVENAFKHGVNKTVDKAFVEITLLINAKDLHFQIRNSKPIVTIVAEDEGGIGLLNVKKRLALLYPDHHKLDIVEEKDFFQVNLTLSWEA